MYEFLEQQETWLLLDTINRALSPTKPHMLLEKEVFIRTLAYERMLSEDNSLKGFILRLCRKGIISPPEPRSESFCISEELLAVVDPLVQKQLNEHIKKCGKVAEGEALLKQISNPLKRIYVQNAHAHSKAYFSYLRSLYENPDCYGVFVTTHHCLAASSPKEHLQSRISMLRSALPKLFNSENRCMSRLLCTSWSLALYLSYMSRLYPELQTETYKLLKDYFERLYLHLETFPRAA